MSSTIQKKSNVCEQVSEQEWQARVDLAAAYRLVAVYGWDDLIFTHLSSRVPERGPQRGSPAGVPYRPHERRQAR